MKLTNTAQKHKFTHIFRVNQTLVIWQHFTNNKNGKNRRKWKGNARNRACFRSKNVKYIHGTYNNI